MPPIQLYIIIGLLALNMFTGGLYAWTKISLTEKESELVACKEANEELVKTNKVKEVIKINNDDTCISQLNNIRNSEIVLKERNTELQNLLGKALTQLDKKPKEVIKTNTVIVEKYITPPEKEEMTNEEAEAVIEYLNTPVPNAVEQLMLVRTKRKD